MGESEIQKLLREKGLTQDEHEQDVQKEIQKHSELVVEESKGLGN